MGQTLSTQQNYDAAPMKFCKENHGDGPKESAVAEFSELAVEEKPTYFTEPAFVGPGSDGQVVGQNAVPGLRQIVEPNAVPRQLEFKFDCQLAQGSATAAVGRFDHVGELYSQIAKRFSPAVTTEDILFCTANTPKLDMEKLVSGTLDRDDMIFVHIKGRRKETRMVKTETTLGVTITDNGAGKCFVKRIRFGSLCHRLSPAIQVGDHIESINDESMVGKRHVEVARRLRQILLNQALTIRLIEPLQTPFSHLSPPKRHQSRRGNKRSTNIDDGYSTVRFSHDGNSVVMQQKPSRDLVDKLNAVMEAYLGVSDDDLALKLMETAAELRNSFELIEVLAKSELAVFQLPDEMVIDLWGLITDHRQRREPPAVGRGSQEQRQE